MGAGRGLEGHGVHACNLAKILLRQVKDLHGALKRVCGLQRMDASESFQRSSLLIDFGVVLHGTGTQGVEPVIHAMGALRQLCVMAADFIFRHMGQTGGRLPFMFPIQGYPGYITPTDKV